MMAMQHSAPSAREGGCQAVSIPPARAEASACALLATWSSPKQALCFAEAATKTEITSLLPHS